MKILVQKQELLDAINIVQRAVMQKSTQTILEGIYIKADEVLTLVGNCFDLGISCTVDADIRQKGSIVINSKMFGEIVRRLPDATISIEVKGDKVKIECINTVFDIRGIDADDYPLPPDYEEEEIIVVAQGIFREMIKQTSFAVSLDEKRRIMTGVFFEIANGFFSLVAVDGFRLAISRIPVVSDKNLGIVVPGKNITEILKALEGGDELIKIKKAQSLVTFEMTNCRIVSKTIDGEFANYRGYIPTNFETKIIVNCRTLEDSLGRALLMSNDPGRHPVRLHIAKDNLEVVSIAEAGSLNENIAVQNDDGDLKIGFNSKFLIDALKAVPDENVRISFSSQIGPAVLSPISGDRYLHLVLPVRLSSL